jgi:hypothetical protein
MYADNIGVIVYGVSAFIPKCNICKNTELKFNFYYL